MRCGSAWLSACKASFIQLVLVAQLTSGVARAAERVGGEHSLRSLARRRRHIGRSPLRRRCE
eukprot:4123237-Pleurochrysis_carterae.AAC.1